MKKYFYFSFVLVLLMNLISCTSSKVINIETNEIIAEFVIPFSYSKDDGFIPILNVIDNDDGWEYEMEFDSGFSYNYVNLNGLKKMGDAEIEFRRSAIEYFKNEYPNMNKEELDEAIELCFTKNTGMVRFLADLKIGNYITQDVMLEFMPAGYEGYGVSSSYDGMLGFTAFDGIRNFIIDYKTNRIFLNAGQIKGEELPMKMSDIGLFEIQIEVDGILQSAIIDTGSEKVIVRNNYNKPNSELSDEEKILFIETGKVELTKEKGKNVIIKYGNSSQKIRAWKSTYYDAKCSESARLIGYVTTILGYPFFKDKIIQFDFENMKFIISD